MKTHINPYIQSLIKENAIYITTAVVLVILTIFSGIYNFNKIEENNIKIEAYEREIEELRSKSIIINSSLNKKNTKELQVFVKMLNRLIPNTEDFFSIIYALETISKKTGLLINTYSINLNNNDKNKIKITINAVGNQDYFVNYLKTYNFAGNRYITMDTIELTPELSGSFKLQLTFYSKNVSDIQNPILKINDNMLETLSKIKEKMIFDVLEPEEIKGNTNYPKKTNPF